jgi:hypothetical protein
MNLASTNYTSQIKEKFLFYFILIIFIIIHHETDGEHRATSRKGIV